MKIYRIPIILGAMLALCGTALGAADYAGMASRLAKAAEAGGVTRITVGQFSAEGEGAAGEARFAAEKLSSAFSKTGGLQVSDQSVLEMSAGSGAGWLKKLPAKVRPQAMLMGSVFVEGGRVTVMARLVETGSGRVLASDELTSSPRFSQIPPVPDLDWSAPPSAAVMPDPFRDAPSDDGFDCQAAFRRMDALNVKAADMKARYWAAKMKEPGFLAGSLTRNPGSEIRDPQLRQKFYETLGEYYQNGAPELSAAQVKQLENFMQREGDVIDRCGLK